jgi:hypothetical protein
MKAYRTYRALAWIILFATASGAYAATPSINAPDATPPGLQVGTGSAVLPNAPPAVTVNSNLPNGFILFINGQFNPESINTVNWNNPATNQQVMLSPSIASSTQLQVVIPPDLFTFTPPPTAAEQVTITVTEQVSTLTSNPATFTINPLLAPLPTKVLPTATTTLSYSGALAIGGTPPYFVSPAQPIGTLPPGLPLPSDGTVNLSGTPTQAGTFVFGLSVTDVWDNTITIQEGIEVVSTPSIAAPLTPNIVPAGSPDTTITVNGTNFVPTTSLLGTTVPGSQVQLVATASTQPVGLATTFVNGAQLTAVIPQGLLVIPGAEQVSVVQPGGALSGALNLTVAPPSIASLSSATITAQNVAVNLGVIGANYVVNPGESPAASTVILNEVPVVTSLPSGTPGGTLTVVTSHVFSTPGVVFVQVENPGGSISNTVNLTVLPQPIISSTSPAFATAGSPQFTLTVLGVNFTNSMQVALNGIRLSTSFVNAGTLTAIVPQALIRTAGNTALTVVTADNFVTPGFNFPFYSTLLITTTGLPGGATGSTYNASVAATGGLPPYAWSATGLQGLSINSVTGAITGTISATSSYTISVMVTDATRGSATANFTIAVTVPQPPLQINSTNSLPAGVVGTAYNAVLTANGGTGNFSFSLAQGSSLPPGLTINSSGGIGGTPTTPGTFSFTAQVNDTGGNTATAGFSILIRPAPLTVTGPAAIPPVPLGGSISLQFGATGGVPPYSFNFNGNLPAGASLSRTGLLSGSATAIGTYTFSIFAIDSTGTQASKSFTVTEAAPQLAVTATLGGGQVGVSYSGTVSASGGTPPYSLTVSGLPTGLSFANGGVSGTPTTAGTYTVQVTAKDSTGAQATGSFTVVIQPAGLTLSANLGNGTVGVPYTGSVSASGGIPPYTFSFTGLPTGVTGAPDGTVSGTPTAAGPFTIVANVTDSQKNTARATYSVTIAVPTLTITSVAVPNATVGTTLSATFTASGGVPPYTWSATGLPAGLSVSTGGLLSGAPTAPGTPSFTLTVKDNAGNSASQSVKLTIALPAAPPLNLTGLPANSNPATQSTLQIGIGTAYPVDVTVTLTLTFAADSGPDDPTVQFSTGGRTATVTIPAGSTVALTTVGVQTGTVAGTATITSKLVASTVDITPTPAPKITVRVPAAVPTATSVTAAISGNSFTVTVVGFDTTRSITSANFTFTPAAGANLQTTTLTVPVGSIFAAWYASSAATPFGSQFTFTQPFNVQGGVVSIASVSVTLVNSVGSSVPASATLH